jgi:hypothetical protein
VLKDKVLRNARIRPLTQRSCPRHGTTPELQIHAKTDHLCRIPPKALRWSRRFTHKLMSGCTPSSSVPRLITTLSRLNHTFVMGENAIHRVTPYTNSTQKGPFTQTLSHELYPEGIVRTHTHLQSADLRPSPTPPVQPDTMSASHSQMTASCSVHALGINP